MIKNIRNAIGFFIGLIAATITWPLFKLAESLNPTLKEGYVESEEDNAAISVKQSTPIVFKDLASYLRDITTEEDREGACIAICRNLKQFSLDKDGAIKLSFSYLRSYKDGVAQDVSVESTVSGHNNQRWYKLSNLDLTFASLVEVINEMIESLAQEGWACTNDGADQIFRYIHHSSEQNHDYLLQRSKVTGEEARLRIHVSLIVNLSEKPHHSTTLPRLYGRMLIWPDLKSEPVESTHSVFFRQQNNNIKHKA